MENNGLSEFVLGLFGIGSAQAAGQERKRWDGVSTQTKRAAAQDPDLAPLFDVPYTGGKEKEQPTQRLYQPKINYNAPGGMQQAEIDAEKIINQNREKYGLGDPRAFGSMELYNKRYRQVRDTLSRQIVEQFRADLTRQQQQMPQERRR